MAPLVLSIIGSFGGVIVFIGAIITVVRSIFSLSGATKENTKALQTLTQHMERVEARVQKNEIRLARVEGRGGNGAIH